MKLKIMKNILIISIFVIIGVACQKDDWSPVELTTNGCANTSDVINTLNDITGKIEKRNELSSSIYFIVVDDSNSTEELLFIPCNLPEEYYRNGIQIIFDAEVLDIDDTVLNSESQVDLLGIPIRLLNAKIK